MSAAGAAPPRVLVVLGSDSDVPVMGACLKTLEKLGIPHELRICSAHRSPRTAHELAAGARARGISVVIAAAGGAAHLAGTLAAVTTLPVIGVPLASSAIGGLDALYSTVMMPPGVPVATVSVGEWGAKNAAVLAAQILAVADAALAARLADMKREMEAEVQRKDAAARERPGAGSS